MATKITSTSLPVAPDTQRQKITHFDLDKIDKSFPMPSYRDGQKEAIEFVLESFNKGKRIVILECPTGSGKSAIGMTVADMVHNSYYLTITKILQDQLVRDFHRSIVELKGRNAYPCTFYNREGEKMVTRKLWSRTQLEETMAKYHDCATGFCKTRWHAGKSHMCELCFPVDGPFGDGRSKGDLERLPMGMRYCACPYYEQVYRAMMARKVVMNFSSFLFQTTMTRRFDIPRDLLIIDECLHPHSRVQTEVGLMPIGKLVNQQMDVRVASYNMLTRQVEYKRIVRWLKRDKKLTYRVLAGNRVLYPTADHKIFTTSGKKKLSELSVGDGVYVREPEITADQEQLILGSLLGDASLQIVESKRMSKKYINKGVRARVRFRHGPKQLDFLKWKYQLLQPHARTEPILKPSAGFTKMTASFSTSCNMYDVVEDTLVDSRKTPNLKWLNKISSLGLAVWFMDDGSLSANSARFNSHGFTLEENETIVEWLNKSWGLDATVKQTRKRDKVLYYIQLGRESTRLLMHIIAQHIPEFMRYKLPRLVPHDLHTGWALRNPHRSQDIAVLPSIATKVSVWPAYDNTVEIQKCGEISVRRITSIEPYKTTFNYDLEVADNHNYFAGNTLVSNCHNIEPQLLDFVSFSINDSHLQKQGLFIPDLDTPYEYYLWFQEVKVVKHLEEAIRKATEKDDPHLIEDLQRLAKKYQLFVSRIEDESNKHDTEWVSEYEEKTNNSGVVTYRAVTIKPVFVRGFAEELLFQYADRILMMSATILDVNVICDSLGLKKADVASKRIRNRFPKENRPIYLKTVAKMTGGKEAMHKWAPALVKGVNEIVQEHAGEKGIIHTHNFAIMECLLTRCEPDVQARFLNQRDFLNKTKMLAEHAVRDDTVIVAPAMHEGIDLVDALSRFQIICKIPFANFFDNKQLARRVEIDRKYYLWLTALKLVQSYGRSIRSETDYAATYILDESIYRFLDDTKSMLPSWFMEAVQEWSAKH